MHSECIWHGVAWSMDINKRAGSKLVAFLTTSSNATGEQASSERTAQIRRRLQALLVVPALAFYFGLMARDVC
eukprot:3002526-Amphidinium_carterae.1